mmetsp:Transcript_59936/g.167946  ORF Transcript_59936/g.167946 Transcript_59936/m.167946 type:complete len:429 (-) Transcript_59936:140-1426(-)
MRGFLAACTRRDRQCCDLNDSFFGEDAFYRDAFYDCDEGNKSHDSLFAKAREQAKLKIRKGTMAANYAAFELSRKTGVRDALNQCVRSSGKLEDEKPVFPPSPRRHLGRAPLLAGGTPEWWGQTMDEWNEPDTFPETGEGPYWSKGHGEGFMVRTGPNYKKEGLKTQSQSSMYVAVSCDAVRGQDKITDVVTKYAHGRLPPPPSCSESSQGAAPMEWTRDCPLPRVICINMMMPHTTGVVPMVKDAGCSFVGYFHIKPDTIREARSEKPSPAVRLFMDFWQGPAGAPDGPLTDPNRSLFARVDKKVKKDQQSGLFKVIAQCLNPSDVNVPAMLHAYNGKPCLITKCGYIIKDPNLEWLEIGIDVRGFNLLARKMLCSLRHLLPRTKIHYGFLIQGVEDEDLPEGIVCDMYVHGCDMMNDPKLLDAPAV